MNKIARVSCIFLFLIYGIQKPLAQGDELTVAFYNLENLFDTIHDSGKNDYEFLPEGKKNWTSEKYQDKLNKLSRVVLSIDSDWQGPDVIGLCEVENLKVLLDLVKTTNLKHQNYGIVHHESPDPRGIDVALLYKKDKLKWVSDTAISIPNTKTRDILRVDLKNSKDTLSFYVNHWSSRRGGETKSAPKRAYQASVLRANLLLNHHPIVIMGDFNDTPQDQSILTHAQFLCTHSSFTNMACQATGTLKHKQDWQTFDQIIISDHLYPFSSPMVVHQKTFLLEKDHTYTGEKPFRAFKGDIYTGGFSDHLPVYIKLDLK